MGVGRWKAIGFLLAGLSLVGPRASAGSLETAAADDWPARLEVSGSILIAAGPGLDGTARARFLEAVGADGSFAVLDTGGRNRFHDAELSAAAVADFDAKELEKGVEELRGVLAEATGLFVCGEGPWLLLRTDGLREVLVDLLERGGVVGGLGPAGAALGSSWLEGFGVRVGLGLLPDAVIERASDEGPAVRLTKAVADAGGCFGVRMSPESALWLSGRRMRSSGGSVSLHLAAAGRLPERAEELRPGDRRAVADLTAWRRDARERIRRDHPGIEVGLPEVPVGTLVIVGGGGMPDGLWSDMIEWSGGGDSRWVYVPCSEEKRIDDEPRTVASLRQSGAGEATWIHTKDREEADSAERILGPLQEATGLWYGGGRQWNFVDSYHDTRAHELMKEVLARGGVIGGSSAGASIQGVYLARADPLGNLNILAPGYERGLGFLDGVAIDQHFRQRNRFPDMSGLVDTYPELLGIGIDESTALIVRGTIGEIRGRGRVHFYDRSEEFDGEKDHFSVGDGGRYELIERRVIDWGKDGDGAEAGGGDDGDGAR